MIKEKKKNTKYNYKKSKARILIEYVRTVLCSFLLAIFITTGLALHARNEMIKDIYASKNIQKHLDRKVALEIITQTSLLKDLKNKTYSVCMHAGEICEIAEDYADAQMAYELAILKTKKNNYTPYYKLICVLAAQEKFDDATAVIEHIPDISSKKLIKFKTRSYMTIGDKYYSIGKFLSAAKSYEKAKFYYDKFSQKDKLVDNSITERIVNSYSQTADVMVKTGLNSDAVRFLKKAEKYTPEDFNIKYKLAIILSDSDPEKSVYYLEKLLEEMPQEIDYGVYNTALIKAANIADLDNRPTQAKYYRYKIHSIDLFINRKVVYKNDIETTLTAFDLKKEFFKYPLKATYQFLNVSNIDIINLKGDFVLCINDKPVETVTKTIANKNTPLYSYSNEPNSVKVKFNKKIFTHKELENYTVKIYLYKDEKYKTLVSENRIPKKSF